MTHLHLTISIIIFSFLPSLFAGELPLPDAATTKILKEFEISFEAAGKNVNPDEQFKIISGELLKLGKKLTDAQLPSVEAYALTKDAERMRWWYAYFFVERGKFDAAAHLFVDNLVSDKESRSYKMWKYWEHYLGERENFKELNRSIGIALMRQFEIGNAEYKQVVSELFGKGEAEAKLSVEEFKKVLDFDRKIAK